MAVEEVGVGYVRLLPSMRGFSGEVSKGLKDTDASMETAGRGSGKRFGSGFAVAAKAGMALAVTTAAAFAGKAISAASDLSESISKVDTVFGDAAESVQAWSKTTASSIGLSRTEALGAVGAFGNMFDQLGIGAQASKDMSTGMVTLAADFASFHNADITDVLDAQQAAFRGEYDSLQRFLPLVNAATVEQKALAMTGKGTTKELTAQEKALAVHALMLEGAGEAAGDFSRTSGGLANQVRILKAQAADFAANVGTFLIPIVLKGLKAFKAFAGLLKDTVAPVFEVIRDGATQVFNSLFKGDFTGGGPFSEDSPFIDIVFDVREALLRFKDTVSDVVTTVRGWFAGFGASLQSDSTQAGATLNKLVGIVGQVRDAFISGFGAVQAVVATAVDFLRGVWRVFGDDLVSFTREAIANVLETFRGVINFVSGIFDLIKAVLTGKWGEAWDAVKKTLDGAWDTIFGVIRAAVTNVIPTILAALGQIVASTLRTAWNGLTQPLEVALGWARDRFNEFVGFLAGLPGRIGRAALGMFDGIKDAFKSAINWIIGKWNNIRVPALTIGGFDPLGPFGPSVPEVTIGGWGFPQIPALASGGHITRRGLALVGEDGPELVDLNRGATVIPFDATPARGSDGSHRAPLVGELTLNAADMTAPDIAEELYWLRVSRGA